MELLYRVVSIVPVLGIMIVVHELGHFLAAKFFGVRVEAFSIGFGKPLFAVRYGETEYRLSPIPLGGYVKMAGETPMDEHNGDAGEFVSHPRWQRLIIAVAGPFMNIMLAIVLLTAVYTIHYEHPYALDQPAVIADVLEDSAAAAAGIQPMDRIVQLGGAQNPNWQDVMNGTLLNANTPVNIVVQRGDKQLPVTVVPRPVGEEKFGSVGWIPAQPFIVTKVYADTPAAKAGIKIDDEVLALNGRPLKSTHDLLRGLQASGAKPVDLLLTRAGRQVTLAITPALLPDADGHPGKDYRIGIESNPIHVDKLPLGQAFSRSLEQNKSYSLLILDLVHKMFQNKVSVKQMAGPIQISRATGDAMRQKGWTPLMEIMAAISLNLGVFNLFPIPILDGGLIILLLIEGAMRRDISQNVKERIYQAAFVCLILFAGLVIFNDVVKEFAHRVP